MGNNNIMSKTIPQRKRASGLPMTAAFVSGKREDGKVVAYSLDFDLVAVADDKENAFRKLRLAVKTYVEYGLNNNWMADIQFAAPPELWDAFAESKSVGVSGPPIEIEDDRMIVVHATMSDHEHRRAACPA